MSDSTVSDLLRLRLERNAERHAEIRAMNFGLGIPSEHWTEFTELPHQQARLRKEWVSAMRAEGKIVQDFDDITNDAPAAPVPGLRIENKDNGSIRVYMYGVIGEDFKADDLKTVMMENPSTPIELRVNSEGGDVGNGTAIHALIAAHNAPVNVVVDSLAASAASFSIMSATTISMAPGSFMMIHLASASLENGSAADFAAAAKRLEQVNESLKKFYSPRWKGTDAQLGRALAEERYFSAEECIMAGLADRVLDLSTPKMAACVSREFRHEHAPAELSIAARSGPWKFLNHPSRQMTLHRLVTHKG